MTKKISIIALFTLFALGLSAQIGVRAGVNVANQSLRGDLPDFKSSELTGCQIGLIYQFMPKKTGFGLESGLLFSQRGSGFDYNDELYKGYNEFNYLEVPLNLRFRLTLGHIGAFVYGGLYGSYLLRAKTVFAGSDTEFSLKLNDFVEHVDYGYAFGFGVELLQKLQIGVNWNDGLNDISSIYREEMKITSGKNRMLSVNVTFLF